MSEGWYLDFGSSWHGKHWTRWFAREFGEQKRAVLVHDLTPLTLEIGAYPRAFVDQFQDYVLNYVSGSNVVFYYSDATKDDLVAFLGAHNRPVPHLAKIRLGFDGVGQSSLRNGEAVGQQSGSYFLLVSAMTPRKRHDLILDVWEALPGLTSQVPRLVIVGNQTPDRTGYGEAILHRIRASSFLSRTVAVKGQVDDEELARLYRGCRALIYPSILEGWGLPISEALSIGRIPVYRNASSMPEAAQHLGLPIDDDTVEGWSTAVLALWRDEALRTRLEREIANRFVANSWGDTATDILAALAIYDRGGASFAVG